MESGGTKVNPTVTKPVNPPLVSCSWRGCFGSERAGDVGDVCSRWPDPLS